MKAPRHRIDPDGRRLPIKLDTTSNGEFVPVPLSRANRHANHLAQEAADANAKRLAMGRRDFLLSSCGAASTLLAFNAANAAAGRTGGYFDLPAVAATEPAAAAATLETGEFIFDVQGASTSTRPRPGSRSRPNRRSRGRRRPAARSPTARRRAATSPASAPRNS